MKHLAFILAAFIAVAGLSSCQNRQLSLNEKIRLGSTSMNFNQQGAEIGECGLVSELERGRSSSTNAGGSGCAACAQ